MDLVGESDVYEITPNYSFVLITVGHLTVFQNIHMKPNKMNVRTLFDRRCWFSISSTSSFCPTQNMALAYYSLSPAQSGLLLGTARESEAVGIVSSQVLNYSEVKGQIFFNPQQQQ